MKLGQINMGVAAVAKSCVLPKIFRSQSIGDFLHIFFFLFFGGVSHRAGEI